VQLLHHPATQNIQVNKAPDYNTDKT